MALFISWLSDFISLEQNSRRCQLQIFTFFSEQPDNNNYFRYLYRQ